MLVDMTTLVRATVGAAAKFILARRMTLSVEKAAAGCVPAKAFGAREVVVGVFSIGVVLGFGSGEYI